MLVGENKVCKISDFGLARGLQGDVYTRSTQVIVNLSLNKHRKQLNVTLVIHSFVHTFLHLIEAGSFVRAYDILVC